MQLLLLLTYLCIYVFIFYWNWIQVVRDSVSPWKKGTEKQSGQYVDCIFTKHQNAVLSDWILEKVFLETERITKKV